MFFPAFQKLSEALSQTVKELFPEASYTKQLGKGKERQMTAGLMGAELEIPKHEKFGDFSSSAPMKIAKSAARPPIAIAQEIVDVLEIPEEFEKPSTAAPGFINFSLKKEFLTKFANETAENPAKLKPDFDIEDKTIVTDISHPNVAKPMGVHHLLSTVIGDSLNRLFAYAGYKVVRDNYLGDWGTQFGKLIYAYKTWGDGKAVAKNPIPELLKLYVKFHEKAEKDSSLEDKGRLEFKKLEDGDAENRKLWEWVVKLSKEEFYKIWDLLDVKFDVINAESFYEDKMSEIIDLGIKKDFFVKGERGALICEFPHEGYPPALIKKADGATLYATRDLARIKYWEEKWHPELMVNVVDVAQTLYFKQLFSMAENLELTDALNIHVSFGRMKFPDERMSTRKGNIVLLEELIDEIIALARKIVEEKNPDLSRAKKDEVAKIVGLGALKFAILIQNRETNVTFTWKRMLSLEGESAPYVQYAYARAKSILRKAGDQGLNSIKKSKYTLSERDEINLARMFPKFKLVIAQTVKEFKPSHLARYLCEVSAKFNAFYNTCAVLQAEDSSVCGGRLALVSATAAVLKTGLNLLGIQAPEEM